MLWHVLGWIAVIWLSLNVGAFLWLGVRHVRGERPNAAAMLAKAAVKGKRADEPAPEDAPDERDVALEIRKFRREMHRIDPAAYFKGDEDV